MKNKVVLVISIFVIATIFSIISYVMLGERSLFFRISLFILLVLSLVLAIYFRSNIKEKFRRGKMSRVKLIESVSFLIFSIAFISFINTFDTTFDWTSRQIFRLSKESRAMVSKLEKPLKITIFSYDEEGVQGLIDYAKNLSKRYVLANPTQISLENIDPIKNKARADEYHIRQNGTIVFEMDGRKEYVTPNLLVESFSEGQISYKGETIFSAVIDKLNSNKDIVISYVTGHGELDFNSSSLGGYDGIKKMLTDRRYEFNAINLDHHTEVPKETDVLIIASPKTEMSPNSYKLIDRYINGGGSILYLIDRNTVESLNYLLIQSGFAFIPNVAIDPSRTAVKVGEFSIIPTLSPKSEITTLLRNKKQSVVFPSASIVTVVPEESSDKNFTYDISPLARMTSQGFGETAFKKGFYNKDDNDIIDITCLAISSIAADKNDLNKQRRAVVFGSTDFIDNARLYTGGNASFFINAVDFLLRKDLKTTIAPKTEDLSQSVPQPEQTRVILVLVLAWILSCLIIASIILIKRKNLVKNK